MNVVATTCHNLNLCGSRYSACSQHIIENEAATSTTLHVVFCENRSMQYRRVSVLLNYDRLSCGDWLSYDVFASLYSLLHLDLALSVFLNVFDMITTISRVLSPRCFCVYLTLRGDTFLSLDYGSLATLTLDIEMIIPVSLPVHIGVARILSGGALFCQKSWWPFFSRRPQRPSKYTSKSNLSHPAKLSKNWLLLWLGSALRVGCTYTFCPVN